MGKAVIRGGIDAWVGAGAPNMEHPRSPYLRVTQGVHEAFVYLRNPAPPGATVTSATLRFHVRNSNGTARTLTARRISEKWGARRINWNNRPTTEGVDRTAFLPAGHVRGDVVEFDVTTHVQTVANGDSHFGWKITSDNADRLLLYSLQGGRDKPVLDVEWSDAPDAPTSLAPNEGAVSRERPTLEFDYTDVSGSTSLAAVQVQIDPAQDEVTPEFDSGEFSTTVPEFNLNTFSSARTVTVNTTLDSTTVTGAAGTFDTTLDVGQAIEGSGIPAGATLASVESDTSATLSAPATATASGVSATITRTFLGLTPNVVSYWRVRVKDEAGLWSEWSDWATILCIPHGTVTIINPADIASPYVTEPTPTIAWSYDGTQTAWQVRITRKDNRGVVLYDSRKRKGTATEHTLPEGVLKDDRQYSVNVRVWDDEDREAVPYDPIFAFAWRDFFMDDDANTPGAQTLTAETVGVTPWVDLTWTRDTMPDEFAIYRDNTVVKVLDPSDVYVSGTTYSWRDVMADPYREHTWKVKAVVNNKQSTAGQTATASTNPVGIWLIDYDRDIIVSIAGDDEGSWEMTDDASVYTPIGSDSPVRIVGGLRGYEGTLSGVLIDGFNGQTIAAQEDDLWSIKERPSHTVRLIAGDVNTRVLIGNVTLAPRPITRAGEVVKSVTFDFWQVGELPFEPRL